MHLRRRHRTAGLVVCHRAAFLVFMLLVCAAPVFAQTQTAQYTYDSLGRLTSVRYADHSMQYTYDAAGNCISMTVDASNPIPAVTGVSSIVVAQTTGTVSVTVTGTGFVNGAVVRWNGEARATTFVSSVELTALLIPADVATPGSATLTVSNPEPGGGESGAFTATVDLFRRYFAEGASSGLFDCYFALANPSATTTAHVTLTFLRSDSQTYTHTETVPPRSRRTVNVKDVPGMWFAPAFSTILESDAAVVADRTMTWDATGYGSHAETAIKEPAQTWYLAEGATQNGFQLYYCIENPNADPVDVEVTYLRRAPNPPLTITYPGIPGYARKTIYVNGEDARLAWGDVSAVITSVTPNRPIIVERAMYLDSEGVMFNAGHDSAGVTAPATEWFLAEGATVATFDMFITLANPGTVPGTATITYMLTDGRNMVKTHPVAAGSRQTVWVNGEVDDADPTFTLSRVSLSAKIQSTVPVIVERSMWWSAVRGGPWIEATNAMGTTETGTIWAVADGEQGGSRSTDTYVLVANTSAFPASVKLTALAEDGEAGSVMSTLPANSRKTFWMGDWSNLAGKKFGAIVESLPAADGTAQIVVERAMYSNANGVVWAAGTDVVATKLK